MSTQPAANGPLVARRVVTTRAVGACLGVMVPWLTIVYLQVSVDDDRIQQQVLYENGAMLRLPLTR